MASVASGCGRSLNGTVSYGSSIRHGVLSLFHDAISGGEFFGRASASARHGCVRRNAPVTAHCCRDSGVSTSARRAALFYLRGGTRGEPRIANGIKTTGKRCGRQKVLVRPLAPRRQFCCCMDEKAAAEAGSRRRRVFLSFIKPVIRLAQTGYWYCY